MELLARHAAILFVEDLIDGAFCFCHVERSRDISYCLTSAMPRDYDFWIYIVTNRNHSVLYIGVNPSWLDLGMDVLQER
jgi:hypothetical protein